MYMKFTQKSDLKRHQSYKHTFEKPFQCNKCNSKYVKKSNFKRHQRKNHKFEKQFKCFLCNKQFVAKYVRKLHLQTHTGVKFNKS